MLRILLCAALLAGAAWADCEKDSDCKAGRACVAGKCVDRKSCFKDADCPGDQVCETSRCVAPSGPPPGWGTKPSAPAAAAPVHEQEAAAGAGMALQYTKNTWPLSIVDRPLVVAPGMAEAQLGINKDISADLGAGQRHPFIADLYARYGVSDRIHAGLDVLSLCLSDCLTGSFNFLQAVSVGAGYAVIAERDQNFVPSITLAVLNTGNGPLLTFNPGFLYGYRVNSGMQIAASGGLLLGVIGRDNTNDPDFGVLHLEPRLVVVPRFSLAPFIGIIMPFKDSQFYSVPLGVGLLYIADRAIDIGASFQFDDIAARVAPGSFDLRSFRLFGTLRL
ncbi:MAG TPA: EB domain-containing protein [Myxococcales bacterium]